MSKRKAVVKTRSVEELLRLLEDFEARETAHIEDFEGAEATIAELETRIEELEDEVSDLEGQATDLQGQIDDLESEENDATEKLEAFMVELRELLDEYDA